MATIKGKWVFNETPTQPSAEFSVNVNYTNGGTSYSSIQYSSKLHPFLTPALYGDNSHEYIFYNFGDTTWIGERSFDFGSAEQTVSDTFYTWFTANATQQESEEEKSGVTITYNGSVIVSLEAGQTATLNCAGKIMAGDIIVNAPADSGGGSGDVAVVTITNTSTTHRGYLYYLGTAEHSNQIDYGGNGGGALATWLGKNVTVTYAVPVGAILEFAGNDGTMPAISITEISGECSVSNYTKVTVNGDCTIKCRAFDND